MTASTPETANGRANRGPLWLTIGVTLVLLGALPLVAHWLARRLGPPARPEPSLWRSAAAAPAGSPTTTRPPGETITSSASAAAAPLPARVDTTEPLEIELDVALAELVVVPGPAGDRPEVTAHYDPDRFRLDQERHRRGGHLVDSIRFGPRSSVIGSLRHQENDNRVRVRLPAGVPLVLTGRVRMAESRLELGGLDLLDVDLDLGVGEHTLSFDSPLLRPLGRLRVDASLGDLRLERLGNASPRRLEVHHTMGDLVVDLTGAWRNDADGEVRFGLGDCRVLAPDAAHLRLDKGMSLGEEHDGHDEANLPAGAPELRLRVHGRMGDLKIL